MRFISVKLLLMSMFLCCLPRAQGITSYAQKLSGIEYEIVAHLEIPHVSQADWSPDGTRLAITAYPTIQIWDTENWKLLQTISDAPAYSTKWNPDGSMLAGVQGGNETVLVWDAKTGKILQKLIREKPTGTKGDLIVHDLAWSPDGKKIATDSGQRNKDLLLIWDLTNSINNPQSLVIVAQNILADDWMNIGDLEWSHNGQWLLSSGSDGNYRSKSIIRLWDATTGEVIRTIFPGFSPVWGPNDKQFAGLTMRDNAYFINVWDVETGNVISTSKAHKNGTHVLSWNFTANAIAGAALGDHLIIWDVQTGARYEIQDIQTPFIGSVQWKPNSNQLAIADLDKGVFIINFEFNTHD